MADAGLLTRRMKSAIINSFERTRWAVEIEADDSSFASRQSTTLQYSHALSEACPFGHYMDMDSTQRV